MISAAVSGGLSASSQSCASPRNEPLTLTSFKQVFQRCPSSLVVERRVQRVVQFDRRLKADTRSEQASCVVLCRSTVCKDSLPSMVLTNMRQCCSLWVNNPTIYYKNRSIYPLMETLP